MSARLLRLLCEHPNNIDSNTCSNKDMGLRFGLDFNRFKSNKINDVTLVLTVSVKFSISQIRRYNDLI